MEASNRLAQAIQLAGENGKTWIQNLQVCLRSFRSYPVCYPSKKKAKEEKTA